AQVVFGCNVGEAVQARKLQAWIDEDIRITIETDPPFIKQRWTKGMVVRRSEQVIALRARRPKRREIGIGIQGINLVIDEAAAQLVGVGEIVVAASHNRVLVR